jgi:nucleoside-diphosphate-sugar epimerase
MAPLPQMAQVVITGGEGFVGSALTAALGCAGHSVVPLTRSQFTLQNFQEPAAALKSTLRHSEAIVHLAARAHVVKEVHPDPIGEFRRINVDGSLAVAELAMRVGVRRFVFVSSIGVLGDASSNLGLNERDIPAPKSPYAQSKYEAELALWDFARQSGLEIVVVRPPLVYGPGAKGNFKRLLTLVSSGMPLPFGSVRNLRSYVGLDNLCDFLITCALNSKAAGNTFHIADGEDISTPDLIRLLASAMHRKARMFPLPAVLLRGGASMFGRESDLARLTGDLRVDSTLARMVLDWRPVQELRGGLKSMAEYFISRH